MISSLAWRILKTRRRQGDEIIDAQDVSVVLAQNECEMVCYDLLLANRAFKRSILGVYQAKIFLSPPSDRAKTAGIVYYPMSEAVGIGISEEDVVLLAPELP